MNGWLLDTNIISELRRLKPEPRVFAFIEETPEEQLFVSEVTLAEIRFGIERLADVVKRAELNDWLNQKVRPMFAQRTLPVSEEIVLKWRVLVDAGRKARHTFTQPDLFIAATALCHGLTIVSRDAGDYERAHAPVYNPWPELP